jgi:EAL domain-containing protein (putative c-di-GMP-specific phosphodiesterase class I)
VFQPVVGVEARRVLGLEALVRWQHPQLGTVPPDEFISLAEADGLIVPLERWVLGAATAALAALLAEGRDLRLGVNVSVRHLQAGCLAPDVARALADSGVPPQRLMLEITESVLMADEEGMAGDLATLREMGCVLSLDDFGKGYSSLARLARLPVDILKMDREFVAHIDRDPRTAAIVGSVVELGRTLGMDVVAEGRGDPGAARGPARARLPLPPGLPAGTPGAGRGAARRPRRVRPAAAGRGGRSHGFSPHRPLSGTGQLTPPPGRAQSVRVRPARQLLVVA